MIFNEFKSLNVKVFDKNKKSLKISFKKLLNQKL